MVINLIKYTWLNPIFMLNKTHLWKFGERILYLRDINSAKLRVYENV